MKAGAVSIAGSMLIAASPVLANTSAADVAEPLRQEQGESLTSGDQRFRQLFASWEALDDTGPDGSTLSVTVSIPSRMPLDGSYLTSDFGMRTHPVLGGRRRHKGVDLAAPKGTPIFATADGIVGRAQWLSSYGLYVEIAHGANLETRYAHMSRLAVAPGERVSKGDIIGYVGSTGRSTGPHLHYEVRIDGIAVNPIPYMVETDAQLRLAQAETQTGQGGD
jgi:murein DD-endopeptidase MepM/ murein hydrolase activator NlpD